MSRPAKATGARVRHDTNADNRKRGDIESSLRGSDSLPKPPKFLSQPQRKIFRRITRELGPSGVLSGLDDYIISTFAVAVDRLEAIERQMNEDPELIGSERLTRAQNKYVKDFYRCCNELCLSPQSRAKYSSARVAAEKKPSALMLALEDHAG